MFQPAATRMSRISILSLVIAFAAAHPHSNSNPNKQDTATPQVPGTSEAAEAAAQVIKAELVAAEEEVGGWVLRRVRMVLEGSVGDLKRYCYSFCD